MLELLGATKHYGETVALRPTDLVVPRAETTVLIGPSGCGKSTLLRLFIGLVAPDAGEVRFEGKPLGAELSALRLRMGYVIQDGGLFPHLTTSDNATLMARHLGWPAARIEARLDTLRELTRLAPDTLARFPHEVSGGQRQRVSLIRALFLDPDVILLDEPLAALDPLVRVELARDLKAIFNDLGKTVVMVTHDLAEAAFFADTAVLMRDGRIVQKGPYRELIEQPADAGVTAFVEAQRSLFEEAM